MTRGADLTGFSGPPGALGQPVLPNSSWKAAWRRAELEPSWAGACFWLGLGERSELLMGAFVLRKEGVSTLASASPSRPEGAGGFGQCPGGGGCSARIRPPPPPILPYLLGWDHTSSVAVVEIRALFSPGSRWKEQASPCRFLSRFLYVPLSILFKETGESVPFSLPVFLLGLGRSSFS